NEELRQRGDEVDQLNHFLQAVFTSFGGGVAVIDQSRKIRIWNPGAEDLWGVREDEVRGVDFLEIDTGLPVARLEGGITNSLSGSDGDVSMVVDAVTRRGRAVECRVGITPLRADGQIDGALIIMEILAGSAN